MFSMKWQGGVAPESIDIPYDLFPVVVRDAARNLIRQLGADSVWVAGPLAYAANVQRSFDPELFRVLALKEGEGPALFSRTGWLTGLSQLNSESPDVSLILWETIATMGLRPCPHIEEEIPNLGTLLRHDWGISDAALHAAAKATALWSGICHELAAHSGCYVEHGCGCSHIVRELQSGATFPRLPDDRREHVTREFWEHFFSELALIYVFGFPFALHADHHDRYARTLIAA